METTKNSLVFKVCKYLIEHDIYTAHDESILIQRISNDLHEKDSIIRLIFNHLVENDFMERISVSDFYLGTFVKIGKKLRSIKSKYDDQKWRKKLDKYKRKYHEEHPITDMFDGSGTLIVLTDPPWGIHQNSDWDDDMKKENPEFIKAFDEKMNLLLRRR